MMRSALPWAVFAMTGCDLVYGLRGRTEPDALVDSDIIDAPIDETPCTEVSSTAVAIEDAMILRENGECDPSNRWGSAINVNIGQPSSASTRSRVLLRFTLTPDEIAAFTPGTFVRAKLRLPLGPNACAVPCPSTATGVAVYAVDNRWNEGTNAGHVGTSWCTRYQKPGDTTALWGAPGADGIDDRSALVLGQTLVSATEAASPEATIPFLPQPGALEDLPRWIAGSQLSLILISTTPSGTLYTSAHEAANGGAQLDITACR